MTSHGAQYWTVSTTGSYLSSNDKRAHFGLGADTTARSIEIAWPSGIHQRTLTNVAGDRVVRIEEPKFLADGGGEVSLLRWARMCGLVAIPILGVRCIFAQQPAFSDPHQAASITAGPLADVQAMLELRANSTRQRER